MKKSELKQIIKEEVEKALTKKSTKRVSEGPEKEIQIGHKFKDDDRKVVVIDIDPQNGYVEVETTDGMNSYQGSAEDFGFVFKNNKLYLSPSNISEGSVKNLQLEFSEVVSQILGKDVEIQMANVMDNSVLIVKNEQLDQSTRQEIEDEFNYQTDSNAQVKGHQIKGADTVFILK